MPMPLLRQVAGGLAALREHSRGKLGGERRQSAAHSNRRRVCVAAVMAAAFTSFNAVPARANGRYPLADQIVVDPGNPEHVVARATFGLLDSSDGGKTFRWICERAVGYYGVE